MEKTQNQIDRPNQEVYRNELGNWGETQENSAGGFSAVDPYLWK